MERRARDRRDAQVLAYIKLADRYTRVFGHS